MNVINTGDRGSARSGFRRDLIAGQTPAQTPAERRAALLKAVCARCVEYLLPALKTLFDSADDLLFDLAQKSENYIVQRAYFEAMQEIHRQRTCMEARLKSEFLAVFDRLYQRAVAPALVIAPPVVAGFKSDPINDDDAMREQLIIANLIGKVQRACHEDISALNRRLGVLLGRPELTTGENPAGPATFGAAIQAAVSPVHAGSLVRMLVLILFDRHLTGHLQALYRALNEFLVNQQVLPEIRMPVAKSGSATPIPAVGSSMPATDLLYLLPGTYGAGLPPPSAINIGLIRSLTSLQRGGYTPSGGHGRPCHV